MMGHPIGRSVFSLLLILVSAYAFAITPDGIIADFAATVDSVLDYQCRISEWAIAGRKEESRIINFDFRQPRSMRMDILIGNRYGDPGSRSVYRPDGKVVGMMGSGVMTFPMVVRRDH